MTVPLPTNPFTSGPVILTPKRFIRALPVIDAFEWWASSAARHLRDELNLDLYERLDKKSIVAIARQYPSVVDEWVRMREGQPAHRVRAPRTLGSQEAREWKVLERSS